MPILRKLKRAVRGEVAAKTVALEFARRGRFSLRQWGERALAGRRGRQAARLQPPFSQMNAVELLTHFQRRTRPQFLAGFSELSGTRVASQQGLSPEAPSALVTAAERIVSDHSWPLLGLGDRSFGTAINWHRDPMSGQEWPRDYHSGLNLNRGDGSDVRGLWELNRLPHLITLAQAYAVTNDERFGDEFFQQVESWRLQNPYGYGANWNCAMEVALRAMNLVAAFEVFRHSSRLDEKKLAGLLALFDQHGTFIRRNLEFSYLATSNHYLSDVTGLVWLGLMLPELRQAGAWRDFGLREMLSEMDKQVLDDGADFESSTGYHRFVLELFLYTFIMCRANAVAIDDRYWSKLHAMLEYTRVYLRPDGYAPLVGDSDSGQVLPARRRSGDDHAYVLALGAVVFKDPNLKLPDREMPDEVFWILGEQGVATYRALDSSPALEVSRSFLDAGTHILRDGDLYLLLNASNAGVNGRGSHGHNDALSIEVSACGRAFIVDPGSYVYKADLKERHRFRSTAYHSTIQIDEREQNTTAEHLPFVIGDEAHPYASGCETGSDVDYVAAKHYGYTRFPPPVVHRRTVKFNKPERWWLVRDELAGSGTHDLAIRFHFDTGLEVSRDGGLVRAYDPVSGARLFVSSLDLPEAPEFEKQYTSRDYLAKSESVAACWRVRVQVPCFFRWALVPAGSNVDDLECLILLMRLDEQS